MDTRNTPERICEDDGGIVVADTENRARLRIRIIPAAILFVVGGLFIVTGLVNLTLLAFWPEDTRAQISYIPSPAAGAFWMLAGILFLNARWRYAIAATVVGYLIGLSMEFL